MGLFDFFKRKNAISSQSGQQTKTPAINKNWHVLTALETRLTEMGYAIKRHTQYIVLIVNDELELGVMVVENANNHPSIMHLMVSASHQTYFPKGIIERVLGVGNSL
jgi:hypothetical protein